MEKVVKGPMAGESSHDAGEAFRYKVLEQMSRWSFEWALMKAENMKIHEGCSKVKEELEELKNQCGSTMEVDELKELDEEIQQNGLSLQELLDERVRIREKSSMVEIKVKHLEDAMKKVIVIEQDELDYIDKLGDYYQNNQGDVWKLSSMEALNGHLVGALEQNVMEDKLE